MRLALRKAKGDLVAALRREVSGAVAGDDLLDALRRKGFVISRYGQDDGTMPPLPEVVAKHDAFFRRLLAWQAPIKARRRSAEPRVEAVSDIYPAKDQREALLELVTSAYGTTGTFFYVKCPGCPDLWPSFAGRWKIFVPHVTVGGNFLEFCRPA